MEMRLILVVIATFISNYLSSQEFVGCKSEDLVKLLESQFLRNTEKSNFVAQYKQENETYPNGIKNVTINRDEYYTKTLLFEKGYIITKSEVSPFEKSMETYTLDGNGRMLKYGKHSTFNVKDSVISDETSLIFFNYGDTLTEIHNFHNVQGYKKDFSYTYIYDEKGNVAQKISKDYENRTDTTHYQYDDNRQLTKETLSNGTTILFEYEDGKTSLMTRTYPNSKEKATTKYTYNKKGLLKKVSYEDDENKSLINIKYDDDEQLIEFTYKTQDGKESQDEERQISYDKHGYIKEDWSGYLYEYQYDEKGNWTRCNISRDGKKIESFTRNIIYQ